MNSYVICEFSSMLVFPLIVSSKTIPLLNFDHRNDHSRNIIYDVGELFFQSFTEATHTKILTAMLLPKFVHRNNHIRNIIYDIG